MTTPLNTRLSHLSAAIRRHWAILYAWLVLLAIPLAVMGWTAGRYGPASDDWAFIRHFDSGSYLLGTDASRPLAGLAFGSVFALAGGNLGLVQAISFLLEGLGAILFFDVLRRVFGRWLGAAGIFPALLIALVYDLYPSDVARYWMTLSGANLVQILILAVAWIWVVSSELDKPYYVLGAILVALAILLQLETPALFFGLLPAIVLYYGRPALSRRWLATLVAWYLALGGYLIWRVILVPHAAGSTVSRHITVGSLYSIIRYVPLSLRNLTFFSYQAAFVDDVQALQSHGLGWVLPVTLIVSALVLAGAWLTNRDTLRAAFTAMSLRQWLYFGLFGLVGAAASIAPYYFYLQTAIPYDGVDTRNSFVASIGLCMALGTIILTPALVRLRPGARDAAAGDGAGAAHARPALGGAGLWISAGLAALLLAGGMIRQAQKGVAYTDAWEVQRTYWQRILELDITFRPHSLIVMVGFPKNLDGAPLAGGSWGYQAALQMLYPGFPADIQIVSSGETDGWKVSGGRVSFTRYGEPMSYPIQDIRVLSFDQRSGVVSLVPHLPLDRLSDTIYIDTGENSPSAGLAVDPSIVRLLGAPTTPGACLTHVPVFSHDTAPYDGAVMAVWYPHRQVIDRRAVSRGTALDYAFVAPCNSWIRLYYEPAQPTPGHPLARLLSQYGQGSEFGTAEAGPSPSYDTTFGQLIPASTFLEVDSSTP